MDIEKSFTEIQFIPSPNFSPRKNKIDMIVIHYTGSLQMSGTIEWFKNPKSQVSAHYVIGLYGEVVQMVEEDKKAWHAGYTYWKGEYLHNDRSIGIELVGTKDSAFTDEQYTSLFYLCVHLIKVYDIPLDRIVGHEDIAGEKAKPFLLAKKYPYAGKVDPGPLFSWHKILSKIEEVIEEEKRLLKHDILKEEVLEELYRPQKDILSGKDDISILKKISELIILLIKTIIK
jgi:N-acetyl-anhydromuramyl-L-alanine amidase AmpD